MYICIRIASPHVCRGGFKHILMLFHLWLLFSELGAQELPLETVGSQASLDLNGLYDGALGVPWHVRVQVFV